VDSSYDRVNRHRRAHPAFVVDSADNRGLGRDLDGSAEEAGTKDPPADRGLAEDEVSSEETGFQIRVDR